MDVQRLEDTLRSVIPLLRPWLPLLAVAVAAALSAAPLRAQTAVLSVNVLHDARPVAGARVAAGPVAAVTDAAGRAVLELVAGAHRIRVEHPDLRAAEVRLTLRAAADTAITVVLTAAAVEHEAIIVSSTRTGRRIEDEPVRIEVVGREEIEEKLLMTPGDIAMLLNETAGVRVQPTAPALGGAGVRIQGLRGRYTQILADGLPLYGGTATALAPLQIPPMDLGQVEIIKGAASALYGASALGGVINLISRRPVHEAERELLLNQSTLGATDAVGWASGPLAGDWGFTLLAGAHRHPRTDVDDDGWADLPGYRRLLVRPRLFATDDERGRSLLLTAGAMSEAREGGTVRGGSTPAGTTLRESLDTRRFDAGVAASALLGARHALGVRAAASAQQHDHRIADVRERDDHATFFAELALTGSAGRHLWVAGLALQHDRFAAHALPAFDFAHTVPGLFVQDEYSPATWLTAALSTRLDHHSGHGSFLSPRLSLLLRPADDWTVRASAGAGFLAPGPWTEETEAVGLSRVLPTVLRAERATSAAFDIGRVFGELELNATLFGSRVRHPVQARTAAADPSRLELFNATGDVRTGGAELLARLHAEQLHLTATYVYLRATEPHPDVAGRRDVPLTPRHTAGVVAAWEIEDRGRVAAEAYYTGRQALADNPYRHLSVPHVVLGVLLEAHVARARIFINAENILDTRQTRHDPLLRPTPTAQGRWTTDVWAPLEGRAFNAGVRLAF